MRRFILAALLPVAVFGQTIEECQHAAERNYPLIRQYELTQGATDLTVENIGKGWLPQVSASAQATYQSDVTAWPEQMQTVYKQMGLNMKGLSKDQYRIGVDVTQMVYDGGVIRSQQETARRQGAVSEAQTEVTMYQVRRRVNEMYFGILLIDEQIKLNTDLQALLSGSESKLKSMYEHGTAAESDHRAIRAERLSAIQQGEKLISERQSLSMLLSMLCGIEVKTPVMPTVNGYSANAPVTQDTEADSRRPELKVIDAQLKLADAQEKSLDAALMPKLSIFASGFYGYPGYNLFDDMMRHKWSLNGMVGARLSWNIGALYTRKNDKAKIQLQRDMAETNRKVFLFNNSIEQTQQSESIKRYKKLMANDEEIISLRTSVRKAAESRLAHGIIDVNDLTKEINAENNAKVQRTIHQIEMLKEIYDLRFTRNE